MHEAVVRIRETWQKPNVYELSCNTSLSLAFFRFGSGHNETEKITSYVNVLLPDKHSCVTRHREGIPRHTVCENAIVQ